jgi:murein DD-endopeptidase MepM/ murein hydrolase activator NlpD
MSIPRWRPMVLPPLLVLLGLMTGGSPAAASAEGPASVPRAAEAASGRSATLAETAGALVGSLPGAASGAAGRVAPGVATDAAGRAEAPSAGPARSFRWPVDGTPRVVRRFDPPPRPWSPGHRGVDLAAEPGGLVRAAGDGVILYAGQLAGRPVVSVLHAGGLRTTYEPVLPGVRAGEAVRAGDPLGVLLAGHPGCPEAACLHWGLRRGASYLDPLALLGLGRVRLLPV